MWATINRTIALEWTATKIDFTDQIFAVYSAVVNRQPLFSSRWCLLTYKVYHHRETFESNQRAVMKPSSQKLVSIIEVTYMWTLSCKTDITSKLWKYTHGKVGDPFLFWQMFWEFHFSVAWQPCSFYGINFKASSSYSLNYKSPQDACFWAMEHTIRHMWIMSIFLK